MNNKRKKIKSKKKKRNEKTNKINMHTFSKFPLKCHLFPDHISIIFHEGEKEGGDGMKGGHDITMLIITKI
jgi:hypothetical protein